MESIICVVVGILILVIGIITYKGNISLLHSYHTNRVTEQDKLPFARLTGTGLIIIAVALILMALFTFLAKHYNNKVFAIIGTVTLIVGFVVGLAFTFYAMIKYNKGIF